MAKLSAHGRELGRISGLTWTKAYMSDGKVLKNGGFGWKLYAKCKPGVTPESAYASAVIRQNSFHADRPHYLAYRKALHDTAPLSTRWKLETAISMMPDDPDGVWSDCCDGHGDNVHADLDDIVKLCQLYRIAQDEAKRIRERDSQPSDANDPLHA